MIAAFLQPLASVAGVLALFTAAGALAMRPVAPRGSIGERLGWAFAAGLVLIALPVPLAFLAGVAPGWPAHLGVAGAVAGIGLVLRRPPGPARRSGGGSPALAGAWLLAAALGIGLFAIQALTEPMWSNDYLAIWGLKGKMVFALRQVPDRLFRDEALRFSHPEYPLGVPLLFAGLAFLIGRWDDHAMALVFPAIQFVTVGVVFGWLRRRGASLGVSAAAAALLALFHPLYSAFHTGLADIPLSFAALLLGTSVSDALDRTDGGAAARAALAALLAAGAKNEGLFLTGAAVAVAWLPLGKADRSARATVSVAVAAPALLVWAAHRAWHGRVALKDFDFGYLRPDAWPALAARVAAALSAAAEVALSALPVLAVLGLLFLCGRPSPAGDRPLVLAAAAAAVYLLLPAFGVYPGRPELGPLFLAHTALARTCSALGPLVAAGLAARVAAALTLDGEATGSGAGPRASAGSPEPPPPSTRAS